MNIKKGALPSQHLIHLVGNKYITGTDRSNIKPASLDLTISEDIYEIPGAFQVPKNTSVFAVLQKLKKKKVHHDDPLQVGKYYIAKINENFNLMSSVYGYANPKSTTGRLDMHVRLLADAMPQYDALRAGFKGDIWVQIKTQSFDVQLYPGTPLNQVRLFYSDTRLDRYQLEDMMQKEGLLFSEDVQNPQIKHRMYYKDMQVKDSPDSIVLCLDVCKGRNGEPIGYRAKKTNKIIDYNGKYETAEFFVPVESDKNGMILMPRDSFNILSSIEHVSVPGWLACEMASIDDRFGEFRSHYAGFIDPGWGWSPHAEVLGRPLTLEVRTFENTFAYHGQPIARIKFEQLAEAPEITYDAISSNYTTQSKAKPAKQFY